MDGHSDSDGMNKTIVQADEATLKKINEVKERRQTEVKELSEETINTMKIKELREKLKQLNLDHRGKKQELRERLKTAVNRGDTEEDEEEGETDDTDSEDDNCDYEIKDNDERNKTTRHTRLTKEIIRFTIKDIDNSLPYFSGDDKLSIKKWISDFEEMSTLLQWNDLQKLLYGKRMLQGSAKRFVTYENGIVSWMILRKKLLREFKNETNSALIHEELRKRKRRTEESARQYVGIMQEIASQGYVEEDALIEHVINGIQDREANKTILYEAISLHDLRRRLELYDRRREKEKELESKRQWERRDDGRNKQAKQRSIRDTRIEKKLHCFSCGSAEHDVKNCTDKAKGPKCFACNEFGHLAKDCQTSAKSRFNKTVVNCVKTVQQRLSAVEINGVTCHALIDTGSEVSLIRKDVYRGIGSPSLQPTSRMFTGLGNARTIPTGRFTTKMRIDNDRYEIEMFVVASEAMDNGMILGQNFLKYADVRINKGEIMVMKIVPDSDEASAEVEDFDAPSEGTEISALANINYVEQSELDTCNGQYKDELMSIIEKYKTVENVNTAIETRIVLSDENPVRLRPRRLAFKEKEILDAQIREWLKDGVIRKSRSEYSSPVIIVPKKDGSFRVCIDYRELNKKVIKDRFPMPLIEDCIDALSGAQVFSVLDLKNGFFHVPVAELSRKYTSFVTPSGQYEFIKTPFGLCNSPTSFLRFIDEVFRDLVSRKIVITYMDDLIVPGANEEKAFENLKVTLRTAEMNGLSINWKKCKFLQPEVEFLGHIIRNGQVGPAPNKVKAAQTFPEPTKKKDVQSFLGLTGYFRKFIKNYAKMACPLSNLLKDGAQFQFGEDQRRSFSILKVALSCEPVLRIFQHQAITELHTDASADGYGAVLLQKNKDEKMFHPVHYMSKKTTDAEKKYSSYELELLAIVKAVQKFRVYLLGLDFTIVTDCEAVQKTLHKKDLCPRIARWALMLEEFSYKIEHRSGERLKHVDALSRYPVLVIEDKLYEVIRKRQDEDERLRAIKQILEKESYEDYVLENDLLLKRCGDKNVIALPINMFVETIRRIHENGHFGTKKVVERIKEEFYIPNLSERVDRVISCCVPCILSERKKGKKEGLLSPIPKGDTPLCTYHIDHQGPMVTTGKGYKYMLVVVDAFAKFVWIYPTKTTNASEVITKLIGQQKNFGNPKRIISDKGAAFTSNEFKNYCASESIEHFTTTTGVPRANGQVERINRTIIPVLAKLAIDKPEHWYKHVDQVQRCLNSNHQRAVGMTPFEVLFGVKMRQKEDMRILALVEQEFIQMFDEERNRLRRAAKESIVKIQAENRRSHDKHCKPAVSYKEGDLVAIQRTQFGSGLKIKPKFLGPYKVTKVKRNNRYEVVRVGESEGPKITSTAADFMKPYLGVPSGAEDLQDGRVWVP